MLRVRVLSWCPWETQLDSNSVKLWGLGLVFSFIFDSTFVFKASLPFAADRETREPSVSWSDIAKFVKPFCTESKSPIVSAATAPSTSGGSFSTSPLLLAPPSGDNWKWRLSFWTITRLFFLLLLLSSERSIIDPGRDWYLEMPEPTNNLLDLDAVCGAVSPSVALSLGEEYGDNNGDGQRSSSGTKLRVSVKDELKEQVLLLLLDFEQSNCGKPVNICNINIICEYHFRNGPLLEIAFGCPIISTVTNSQWYFLH